MIQLLKKLLSVLPWLLLISLLSWMFLEEKFFKEDEVQTKEIYHNSILSRAEKIGKLELVKYNFQEVTEIKRVAETIDLKLFKYKPTPDSKAVLISKGSAAGCIDLTQITDESIYEENDTVYVRLPAAELCYFKIDLENSRIYDLQIDYMRNDDRMKFMDELYKLAETNIYNSALDMGILDQTQSNARVILQPLFEELTGKKVILTFTMQGNRTQLE